MKFLNKIFGDPNQKLLKSIQPIVDEINGFEDRFQKMSDEELVSMTDKFREKISSFSKEDMSKKLDEMLPEVFAVVREASKRILGKRHFDEQLIGGIALHRGQIAEVRTGEGKTLLATLPLYLNALTGKGAQLITVNDYLSQVGAGWNGPLFDFLGLSVSVIIHEGAFIYDKDYEDETHRDERLSHFKKVERREAYRADVVYGTNNEFGFDYLRDNMVQSLDKMVQRDLHYAIVDEVDSILIDEARTPLIISAPAEESTDKYFKFSQLVKNLDENEDYNVDEKMKAATLSESGLQKMEKWLGMGNIYVEGGVREVHHIEQALKAQVLFKKDKDYVVKDNEVIIVDEFTGRLMPGRRYSEGLHQAIEAKEGVKVQRESRTFATVTFQNYFRMYEKLAGMTGTAVTEAEEFAKIYKLEVLVVPTHKPMVRNDMNDLIYRTEMGKFLAVAKSAKEMQTKGQPVLVGTISIEKNEILADMMEKEGVNVSVLNAKNHEKEARIIENAGKKGAVTIATNMAGRGVDIILGGVDSTEEEQTEVKALGGLHVVGTERHESRRIDNQLRGRAGRQGDPGSSQFFVSAEDDLMRIFGGDRMKNIMKTLRVPEDMPIENKIISKSIESAQKKVEGHNFDIRKHVVEYDDVINKHREAIYRRRREVLDLSEELDEKKEPSDRALSDVVMEMVEAEIEQVVLFHTANENGKDWNLKEIYEVASTIFPVEKDFEKDLGGFVSEDKDDLAKVRTKIIEYLLKIANTKYNELKEQFKDLGVSWTLIEKSVVLRSIDTLWVEHLEAMSSMRQGIGLRGYGQRDPLVEYKKEAYGMYNELNNLIQKQVTYSIYKLGGLENTQAKNISSPSISDQAKNFLAPSKTMAKGGGSFSQFKQDSSQKNDAVDLVQAKLKDESGKKVGRNDPCPCGSGKKYKKCCGK